MLQCTYDPNNGFYQLLSSLLLQDSGSQSGRPGNAIDIDPSVGICSLNITPRSIRGQEHLSEEHSAVASCVSRKYSNIQNNAITHNTSPDTMNSNVDKLKWSLSPGINGITAEILVLSCSVSEYAYRQLRSWCVFY